MNVLDIVTARAGAGWFRTGADGRDRGWCASPTPLPDARRDQTPGAGSAAGARRGRDPASRQRRHRMIILTAMFTLITAPVVGAPGWSAGVPGTEHPRRPADPGRGRRDDATTPRGRRTTVSRTDDDSWDITEGVGATALTVARARALEWEADCPLYTDPVRPLLHRGGGPRRAWRPPFTEEAWPRWAPQTTR